MSQTAPGWYHGEGDPPGTVRWWDGEVWASDYVVRPPATTAAVASRQYGSWLERVGATFIDGLVVMALFVPVVIVVLIGVSINETLGVILGFIGYLGAVVAMGYLLWWGQGTTGQTPGKRIMGLETIDDISGSYIGGGKGIARGFLAFINSLPLYLGWLWPLFDDKRQTFVDKLLGSVVVKTNRPTGLFPLFPNGKPF